MNGSTDLTDHLLPEISSTRTVVAFRCDMLRVATFLMTLEVLLQPMVFAIGFCNSTNPFMVVIPYIMQVAAILFSLWLQRRVLQKPPSEGPWHNAVHKLMTGTVKFAGFDVRHLTNIDFEVLLNYSIYWAGMADSLAAGQSWSLWTPEHQATWVASWRAVPFLGGVFGFFSQLFTIPLLLTLLTSLHYVLLIVALISVSRDINVFGQKDREHSSRNTELSDLGNYDVGNLPLFSAVCSCHFEERGLPAFHRIRHTYKVCFVAAPHTWLKMDLLAMSWAGSSLTEKFTLMLAIFLQMVNKVSSVIQANVGYYHDMWLEPNSFGFRRMLENFKWVFWALCCQVPLLVFVGCCWKFVGIWACRSHYINLTTGCV